MHYFASIFLVSLVNVLKNNYICHSAFSERATDDCDFHDKDTLSSFHCARGQNSQTWVCPSLPLLARDKYSDLWLCIALTPICTKKMTSPSLHYSSYPDVQLVLMARHHTAAAVFRLTADPSDNEQLATAF